MLATLDPQTIAFRADVLKGLTSPIPADDLNAFRSLGVEVELDVDGAQVHLVPEYSEKDRLELSVEHAATLRRLLQSFPGARLVRIARASTSPAKEVGHE